MRRLDLLRGLGVITGLTLAAFLAAAPIVTAQPNDTRSTGALKMEMDEAGSRFRPSPDPAPTQGLAEPRAGTSLISAQQLAAAEQRLAGIPATLVVVDAASDRVLARIDGAAAARATPPCSTFKLPNALLSLEEGAVSLDDHAIPRDRELIPDDDWRARGAWAQDQDLRSALRQSTVWYFQELARRVGEEAMVEWLETFEYGNQDISGGLDQFWLASSLRISADEQAAFLTRLVRGELPVADEHIDLLKEGIRRDGGKTESGSWTWYGKTGSCQNPPASQTAGKSYGDFPEDTPWVGWLVGWIERPGDGPAGGPIVYAYRVDAANYEELKARRDPIVRPLLTDLGLLPPAVEATPSSAL